MNENKDFAWVPTTGGPSDTEGNGIWIPVSEVIAGGPTPPPPGGREGIWVPPTVIAAAAARAKISKRGRGAGIWIPMERVLAEVHRSAMPEGGKPVRLTVPATTEAKGFVDVPSKTLASLAIWVPM